MTDLPAAADAVSLTREQVAQYLRDNPEFFLDQDELLRTLKLPHDSGRAISLVERQVHLFREQRDALHHELRELVAVARQNDQLFDKSKRLLMQLIEARTLADMAAAVDDSIRGDFGLDAVSLVLFAEPAEVSDALGVLKFASLSEAETELGSLVDSAKAVCGPIREHQRQFLFAEAAPEAASVALIPLRHGDLLGLFAVASRTPGYFDESMGSLFLSYLSDSLSRLLPPLMQRHVRRLSKAGSMVVESR